MCGILGEVSLAGELGVDMNALVSAMDLQRHRGPENGGTYCGPFAAFAHRRLKILDLSDAANQPMVSSDGNWVVVFNGEIYNFQEIRKRLESRGCRFTTNSDTEVLLEAFVEYGPSCVEEFIGMFAFGIHDIRNQKTFIFRDRLGIKPLYFIRQPASLVFASEIKSLLQFARPERILNIAAISSYLSFRYPVLDDSFFSGVESLTPGTYLSIHHGRVAQKRYWSPTDAFSEQAVDRGEYHYRQKVRELLQSSIRYRLIADVPCGAYLSGGIDSGVVTAEMARLSNHPVKTFTIGFDEEEYSEFEYANMVASRFETEHHEIRLSGEEYLDTMQKLIAYKDGPLSVPNEVPLYLLSGELKKHITVVLSGEGADEIFGGYGRIFRAPYDYERYQGAEFADWSPADRSQFENGFSARYGDGPFQDDVEHFLSVYRYTSVEEKNRWLSPDLGLRDCEQRLDQKFREVFNEVPGQSYFNRMSWALIRLHLVGLLHRVDMTTMAKSVEARVPFLDHRLVEFALGIPEKYKVRWVSEAAKRKARTLTAELISEKYDTPKYILKKSYEGVLPQEVLYRSKMGFPVPLDKWFGGSLQPFARDVLLSKSAQERGIYDIAEIKKTLESPELRTQHHLALKIWMLINLEMFCQHYFDTNVFAS